MKSLMEILHQSSGPHPPWKSPWIKKNPLYFDKASTGRINTIQRQIAAVNRQIDLLEITSRIPVRICYRSDRWSA